MYSEILSAVLYLETCLKCNWRARQTLFDQACSFSSFFKPSLLVERLVPVLTSSMKNGVLPVKQVCLELFCTLI